MSSPETQSNLILVIKLLTVIYKYLSTVLIPGPKRTCFFPEHATFLEEMQGCEYTLQ